MKKIAVLLFIVFTATTFWSCETVNIDARTYENPLLMNGQINKDYKIIKHFKESSKAVFLIFNLMTVKNPDVEALITREVTAVHGDGVINIKIIGQTTFVDGLVPVGLEMIGILINPQYGFLGAAILGMRTYFVEGDIIKFTDPEGKTKWEKPVDK